MYPGELDLLVGGPSVIISWGDDAMIITISTFEIADSAHCQSFLVLFRFTLHLVCNANLLAFINLQSNLLELETVNRSWQPILLSFHFFIVYQNVLLKLFVKMTYFGVASSNVLGMVIPRRISFLEESRRRGMANLHSSGIEENEIYSSGSSGNFED